MIAPKNESFFCSWSGGKDACLALYLARREGKSPAALMTTLEEDGRRTRGHGIPLEVIEAQARCLGIPLLARPTTWEGYGDLFLEAMRGFREQGMELGVFGDIELEEHLEWITERCSSVGVRPLFPLWGKPRSELARELLDAGFEAVIVAVKEDRLDRGFLGKKLDAALFEELAELGCDAFGEDGEYHTLVVGGPIFSSPLAVRFGDERHEKDHWFLDMSPG